jgi:hypothetical protein
MARHHHEVAEQVVDERVRQSQRGSTGFVRGMDCIT